MTREYSYKQVSGLSKEEIERFEERIADRGRQFEDITSSGRAIIGVGSMRNKFVEEDVCRLTDVPRTTVRRALNYLIQAGFIERLGFAKRDGRGQNPPVFRRKRVE